MTKNRAFMTLDKKNSFWSKYLSHSLSVNVPGMNLITFKSLHCNAKIYFPSALF